MIDDDSIKHIEKLHQLKNEGVITEADFEAAKQKLLLGGKPRTPTTGTGESFLRAAGPVTLPDDNDLIAWMTLPLKRYADFTGRSCRKEFWMFQLLAIVQLIVFALFGVATTEGLGVAMMIMGVLFLFVPQIAVQVRRFHDMGKPGTYALFNLIPYVGALIIFVFMLQRGELGPNQYGEDPLQDRV